MSFFKKPFAQSHLRAFAEKFFFSRLLSLKQGKGEGPGQEVPGGY